MQKLESILRNFPVPKDYTLFSNSIQTAQTSSRWNAQNISERILAGIGKFYDSNWKTSLFSKEEQSLINTVERWKTAFISKDYVTYQNLSAKMATLPILFSAEKDAWPKRQALEGFLSTFLDINTFEKLHTPEEWKEYLNSRGKEFLSPAEQDKRITAIKKYVQENLTCDISVSSIAEFFKLSPNYLSSLFAEQTGEKIINFISREKLSFVKRLMAETDKPIKEIAESAGFHSQSYFAKLFFSVENMTPSQYREKLCCEKE